jgi:uncharacterized protein (DUF1330 family)
MIKISNLNSFYEMYKHPTYVIADWNIVNNKEYNKYKNKVNIISANYYSVVVDIEADSPEEDLIKSNQIIVNCETKKEYICIKYNPNFIVTSIGDTEYGMIGKEITLLAIKNAKDLTLNKDMPRFKEILKVLGWKISRKAYANLLEQMNFN